MADAGQITVYAEGPGHTISPHLYAHFAEHLGRCVYEGIWVGEHSEIPNEGGIRLDTVEALRRLELPALRWPGGCFADNYHWADGIGSRERRPRRHNLWWDQPEPNSFGTDEFIRFCRMIGTEPYICLNVGSGTVEEARSWVEYCNGSGDTAVANQRRANGSPEPYGVRLWGIGNENWGCGGTMTPEYYAHLYRQYATYVRGTAGPDAKLIACGSPPSQIDWDERFIHGMKGAMRLVDSIALHVYVGRHTPDIAFNEEQYYALIADIDVMDTNLTRATGLARAHSTRDHRIDVVLDEWGTWYEEATVATGLYQQSTMRDALFTAAAFHCLHRHGEWLWMANMAQTVNVLQALVLTRGPELLLTPTYHVYDMFRPHRGGTYVECEATGAGAIRAGELEVGAVSVSATRSEDGEELFLSVANLDLRREYAADLRIRGGRSWEVAEAWRLGGGDIHDHNTFEAPDLVRPERVNMESERAAFPAQSVTTLRLRPAAAHGDEPDGTREREMSD